MYYSKIGISGSGLTNQIISLIVSIMIAHLNNHKVVVVDKFRDDYSKEEFTKISDIIDIDKCNEFLIDTYNIMIVDKYDANFELNTVKYGTIDYAVDITKYVKDNFYKDNILDINTKIVVSNFPNQYKEPKININYKINGYIVDEIMEQPICIDIMNSEYVNTFCDLRSIHKVGRAPTFEDILRNIHYNKNFVKVSESIFEKFSLSYEGEYKEKCKINVIHLRLEDDAIRFWSNEMGEKQFQTSLEKKYIQLIKIYIPKNEEIILLSQTQNNAVVDFLSENGYKYNFSEKFFEGREKNAIVDLLLSQKCNHIFIGAYNIVKKNGSTYSNYISNIINKDVMKVGFDIDNLESLEQTYF